MVEAQIVTSPRSDDVEVYLFDRDAGVSFSVDGNQLLVIAHTPGNLRPPFLRIPAEYWREIARALADVVPEEPTTVEALRDGLTDARLVRDRLLALVEETILRRSASS